MASRDRDRFRKYLSGSEKAKRKLKKDEYLENQRNAMNKFLKIENTGILNSENSENKSCSQEVLERNITNFENIEDGTMTEIQNEFINVEYENPTFNDTIESIVLEKKNVINDDNESENSDKLNIEDPGTWPENITDKLRTHLVKRGPVQIRNFDFPKDEEKGNRKFSDKYYNRKLANGVEKVRRWLVYSKTSNKTFCFACKLYKTNIDSSSLSTKGFNDWTHLSERLSAHERSSNHRLAMNTWLETEKNYKLNNTIDNKYESFVENETVRWKNIFQRIIETILYLAEGNMAFRGINDKLYEPHNGNFLRLIELIAKFDPVLKDHISRSAPTVEGTKRKHTYLSHTIQDELITKMAEKVKFEIVSKIKKAKYYSILLDCTPDVSHQEQLSVVIRFVNTEAAIIEIEERFICFEIVDDTTGQGLSDKIKQLLNFEGLSILDCRGQGYDNGANMKGIYNGVQAHILRQNPKAFFTPCGSHNLNLVLGDIAKSSVFAISFFGTLQKVYNIFSGSTARWDLLKKYVKKLTPKPLSDTRWECRLESVKSIRYQVTEFHAALKELRQKTLDPKIKCEIIGIEDEFMSFEFLVSLIIWYDLLNHVNIVSKILQNSKMCISMATSHLNELLKYFKEFRKAGFISSIITAKELANNLDLDPKFEEKRVRRKKRQFSYEGSDDPIINAQDNFHVNYFLKIVDTAIISFQKRFTTYEEHANIFGFVYTLNKLKDMKQEELLKNCKDLHLKLEGDIDGIDLYEELMMLRNILPQNYSILEALQFIFDNNLSEIYPNSIIVLQIILTSPVTTATAERSFSKLKIIKNYLRSTISQERFTSLSIISIEHDIAKSMDYNDVVLEFAAKRARGLKY